MKRKRFPAGGSVRDYGEAIRDALERTYQRMRFQAHTVDLADIRWVIFSDHHRGQGDGADDFRACKPIYHSALDHYLNAGHSLFLLGDVEELWECYPSRVLREYSDTLALEHRFIEAGPGRYYRLFGNHDDIWSWRGRTGRQTQVEKHLRPHIGSDRVDEAFLFRVKIGSEMREIFFVHGHQGEFINDRYRWFSRMAVRFIWRNIQRIFRIPFNTAATCFDIRGRQERALYGWAVEKKGLMRICGATRHPVFASKIREESILDDIIAWQRKQRRARTGVNCWRPIRRAVQRPCGNRDENRRSETARSVNGHYR